MPRLVEYLSDEQLNVGVVTEQDKKGLLVTDARGRATRVAPDKVLFQHTAASVEALITELEALQHEVDVPLLWESLHAEQDLAAREAGDLARLYFDDGSDAHASAVYRALTADRLHFRRRGRAFAPRGAEEIAQLRQQRETEQRSAEELEQLSEALRRRKVDEALGRRLERFLRQGGDPQLAAALEPMGRDPAHEAFGLLLEAKLLPPTADLEVIQANLPAEHTAAAVEHAARLELPPPLGEPRRAAFSIDDDETREVDDALSVSREGDLLRIDVDIADVASLIAAGDPVDLEAQRRAVTVYLPTGTVLMLPERLGCDLLSLHAGQVRPALRTTVWLDGEGQIVRRALERCSVVVEQRLSYETADQLLESGEGETAGALRLLANAAARLAARRRAAGSLSFRQREFKIRVSPDGRSITVKPIPLDSPSRHLVAEMMILANGLAARFAAESGIPIIYRVQAPPNDPPPALEPDDPLAFVKLRGVLQPAALSLQPGRHAGLGLEGYTQASSPLRRYTDLVIQRQLQAGLVGADPPYTAEELLKVLATAEATERETKRLEATVNTRWTLEYLARQDRRRGLEAMVLAPVPGGYRVELAGCGAHGLLLDSAPREPGERLAVDVKTLRPRQGALRLVPSG